jgi:hypothetical protein
MGFYTVRRSMCKVIDFFLTACEKGGGLVTAYANPNRFIRFALSIDCGDLGPFDHCAGLGAVFCSRMLAVGALRR